MAKELTVYQVRDRFTEEQDHIEQYTRFLRAKSTIHDEQVLELNRILKRVHIDPLPTRSYDRTAEPYSQEETDALLAAIHRAEPEVYQTILGHEQFLDNIPDSGLSSPAEDYLDRKRGILRHEPQLRGGSSPKLKRARALLSRFRDDCKRM